MNLKLSPNRKTGRVYLSIVKGYRAKDSGKVKATTIKSLGYLDELEKEYADPITHFKEIARQMTEEENEQRKGTIPYDLDEALPQNAAGTKNFGYALPLKIYHELGIDEYIKSKAYGENFEYNANSIMILLVIARILYPASKKKTFEEKGRYFERFDFSLDDIYRCLGFFKKISPGLQRFLHENTVRKYGSDTTIVYYDVTNYYFEIKKQDELRRYGKAKQNRKKPITQMGLAMDRDGVPLHYELFPGNRLDKQTFRSVIGEVRKNYDTGRIVVVADMGIITGDNIHYLVGHKPEKPQNGYIFSFSVRGGTDAFQAYVLDAKGYKDDKGDVPTDKTTYKLKHRVIQRDINVTMTDGTKKKRTVYEKQVVFWSMKYFLKARAERNEMIAKAENMIEDPGKFDKATSYGASAYVKNFTIDKKTGEVKAKKDTALILDDAKIKAEEQFDGYYSIVTSELHMSVDEIISTYRGLWEIEETFKITKSDLEDRPVYVSDSDHIDGHFLTCFIALTILRLIQKKTGKQYSAAKIIDCLKKIECMNEQDNIYLFGYRNELSDALGDAFGIDFTKKRLRLADIKKRLGEVKR
jgi:transposase